MGRLGLLLVDVAVLALVFFALRVLLRSDTLFQTAVRRGQRFVIFGLLVIGVYCLLHMGLLAMGTPAARTLMVRFVEIGTLVNPVALGAALIGVISILRGLTREENRFRTFFEHASDAILVVDVENDRILDANPSACHLLEYHKSALLKTPVSTIHAHDMPLLRSFGAAVIRDGRACEDRLQCRTRRSGKIPVEITASAMELDGNQAMLVMLRNISERQQAEKALHAIASGMTVRTGRLFFQALVERLAELLDAEQVFIARLSRDGDQSVHTLAYFSHGKFAESFSYCLAGTPCANVVGQTTCIYPSRVQQRFPKDGMLVEIGAESYIGTPLFDGAKRPTGLICAMGLRPMLNLSRIRAITEIFAARAAVELERLGAEEALRTEKERAEVTLASIADGVIVIDAAQGVEFLNPVAESLTGWSNEEGRGRDVEEVLQLIDQASRRKHRVPIDACLEGWETVGATAPVELVNRNGQEIAIEHSLAPIRNRQGDISGVVVVLHDLTRRRKMARQLAWQASHDALTGLVNRREFQTEMDRMIETARQGAGVSHSLLYLDLDQFKVVNDTCGHMAGDRLLQQIGQFLLTQVRSRDLLARLGGDEFGILLHRCGAENAAQIAENAAQIAEKIRQAMQDSQFAWEDKVFSIGVSIGIAVIDADCGGRNDVLSCADSACYLAKEKGRNQVHRFQPDDADLARRRGEMGWLTRITHALQEDRFIMYYQPIQCMAAGKTQPHGELLVRMIDEQGAIVPPGAFIPAAEHYDQMVLIDRWIVQHVIAQLCQGGDVLSGDFAINISGQALGSSAFREELIGWLKDAAQIRPERLCFEITETAAIGDLVNAKRFMAELKDLGCALALDDFGSGLSSFAYLQALPVDYVKIDGVFVRDIATDPIAYAMVESVHHIAKVMGKQSIAEYAENDAIIEKLAQIGVDFVQGYGVARPRPWLSQATSSAQIARRR